MKKFKVMLTVLCVSIACLLLLTACSSKLSAPSTFRLDPDSLTLSWNKIRDAAAYTVTIDDGDPITTRSTSYSLENLEAGEHVVKIQAITYSGEFRDSDFGEYIFVKEEETGLRYRLNGARDAYELVGIGSASGDVVMEDYYRGKPVTGIAKAALRRCGRITSFVVGKNVKTIGENAFASCAELTSITIPEGVTSIGTNAFQKCDNLQSIVLPNSLENIDPYLFSMCKSLKTVTFGSNVKTIGEYAFADCVALESVTLGDTVTSIGQYAFAGCVAMTNVHIGANIEHIEQYAFVNCSGLTSVSLNDQLKSIGEGAFQMSGLTSVVIPDSVTKISDAAFANCVALKEISLGTGLTSIGYQAFFGSALIEESTEDVIVVGDWVLVVKNLEIEDFIFPENVIGIADGAFNKCSKLERASMENVKYVGAYAFSSCASLWEVILGDANLEIGTYGFAGCPHLSDVKLGNNLLKIGDRAFYQCTQLEDSGINLPKSLMEIGSYAFWGTRTHKVGRGIIYFDDWAVGVADNAAFISAFIQDGTRGIANYAFYNALFYDGLLYMSDSIEIIGRSAFYGNQSLMLTNLPANVKTIGDNAFMNCSYVRFSELSDTIIPYGCEYIGNQSFKNCTYLVGLTIPGTVKYVGNYAFKNCANLGYSMFVTSNEPDAPRVVGDIVFGEGIEYMGEHVFYGCAGLQKIKLPDSLKTLGSRAFYKCTLLEEVTIGAGLTEIPAYTFYNCTALKEVVIPGNIRTIASYAFRGCENMEKVTISEGVETIDKYAFFKSIGVKYLTIADSVTTIGDFAFRGLEQIESIYIPETVTYVGRMAFYGNLNATIYLETAQVPEGWSKRWNASYRPIVYGAQYAEDNSYVVSWTASEEGLENISSFITLSEPSRSGYVFAGWSTVQDDTAVQYASLVDVPVGTTVYSVWTEYVPEETPEEIPEGTPEENPDASADPAA